MHLMHPNCDQIWENRGGSTGSSGHNLMITCLHIYVWLVYFRCCTQLELIPNGRLDTYNQNYNDSIRCTLSHLLYERSNG